MTDKIEIRCSYQDHITELKHLHNNLYICNGSNKWGTLGCGCLYRKEIENGKIVFILTGWNTKEHNKIRGHKQC